MYRRLLTNNLILILFLAVLLLSVHKISYTFANNDVNTINITGPESYTAGPIFSECGLWYPGYSVTRVLRIINSSDSNITLKKIGMNILISKMNETLDLENSYSINYLEKMKLKVEYKNPLENLIKGKIFDGSFEDFVEPVDCFIPIGSRSYVDLIYTVSMDQGADNNVAGVTGNAKFTFSMTGQQQNDDKTGRNRSSSSFHWVHDCIKTLLKYKIIKGYPDGSIKPDNHITRAETAILVAKALNIQEGKNDTSPYVDDIPDWAQGYINVLTEEGVLEGYPGKLFKPLSFISREEMTTVLIRGFDKKMEEDYELKFLDKDKISPWAVKYVKSGVKNKVIEGYPDNTFKPENSITRAEAFTIICKLLGYHETH